VASPVSDFLVLADVICNQYDGGSQDGWPGSRARVNLGFLWKKFGFLISAPAGKETDGSSSGSCGDSGTNSGKTLPIEQISGQLAIRASSRIRYDHAAFDLRDAEVAA
jgi:hypothetical protein